MSSVKGLIAKFGISVTPYTLTDSTVDAGGAVIRSWAAGTAFTMLVQPSMPREEIVAGARRARIDARGYCDITNTLTTGMRIVFGSKTYEVLGFYTPDSRSEPDTMAYQIVTMQSVEGLV